MNRRSITILPGLLALCVSTLSAQHARQVAARIDTLKRRYPCVDSAAVKHTTADAAVRPYSCYLVGAAVHEIALGHAAYLGFPKGDSSHAQPANVIQMKFTGIGGPDDWYWIVTLSFSNHERQVDVAIFQLENRIQVQRTELPLDH